MHSRGPGMCLRMDYVSEPMEAARAEVVATQRYSTVEAFRVSGFVKLNNYCGYLQIFKPNKIPEIYRKYNQLNLQPQPTILTKQIGTLPPTNAI